jgi:hypothetical protein
MGFWIENEVYTSARTFTHSREFHMKGVRRLLKAWREVVPQNDMAS